MIRWNLLPLKCKGFPLFPTPFSPVQRARKFSAVFGATSARRRNSIRFGALLPMATSKKTVGLGILDNNDTVDRIICKSKDLLTSDAPFLGGSAFITMDRLVRKLASVSFKTSSRRFSVQSTSPNRLSDLEEKLASLRDRLDSGPSFSDFTSSSDQTIDQPGSKQPSSAPRAPKPAWLRIDSPTGDRKANLERLQTTVKKLNLATVCEEAKCPNIGECWGGKEGTATATIMLMGDTCSRGCSFCAVKTSRAPPPLDPNEPKRVAEAIADWGLSYVVLTSVTRDDLVDGGSAHIASTVQQLKSMKSSILVECLTPDFNGKQESIERIAHCGLDVFAHNVETVERLQSRVRDHRANWKQSLLVLQKAKEYNPRLVTKTSIMLGVGETKDDLMKAITDIRSAGIDVLTFGQYLRPSKRHMPVDRYIPPEEFNEWKKVAEDAGFLYVASGPLVRSSYKAGEFFLEGVIRKKQGEHAHVTMA
jgi:lipoyl synthase